jgi:hypothetical protein
MVSNFQFRAKYGELTRPGLDPCRVMDDKPMLPHQARGSASRRARRPPSQAPARLAKQGGQTGSLTQPAAQLRGNGGQLVGGRARNPPKRQCLRQCIAAM